MKKFFLMAAMMMGIAVLALADIPQPSRPKTSKSIDTMLSIRLDHDAKEAKLIIPAGQIKELRAALEQMDTGNTGGSTTGANSSFSRLQTVVGGVFLSLAIVFGGIWFARSGRLSTGGGKAAAALMAVFAAGAFATMVYANAGPPAEARSITGKMFTPAVHMYGFGSGAIKLEAGADDNVVTLIVPDPKDAKPAGEE